MNPKSTIPLVAIVGETGTGKSSLAIDIAKQFNGEIITADARTVYKGMDIGTAKPTTEDQKKVVHHLLDVCSPDEHMTAAIFKEKASVAIKTIKNRGKLPILVGGTGLYVDAVLFDYSFRPLTDQKLRKKLQQLTPKELIAHANKLNINIDQSVAKNRRYLERLIETNGQSATKQAISPNSLVLGLSISRSELRERLQKRIGKMMSQGLEFEVKSLVQHYGWEAPGLNAIGYKEWIDYFNHTISRRAVRAAILKNSLHLAKRQRTWFKRNRHIQWVSSRDEAIQKVAHLVSHQPDLLQ